MERVVVRMGGSAKEEEEEKERDREREAQTGSSYSPALLAS